MKNNNYVIKNIMKPKGLKCMSEGGPIKDWWDDRFVRRRGRKRKRAQNKARKTTIKQCERDSKRPMCKRRR